MQQQPFLENVFNDTKNKRFEKCHGHFQLVAIQECGSLSNMILILSEGLSEKRAEIWTPENWCAADDGKQLSLRL